MESSSILEVFFYSLLFFHCYLISLSSTCLSSTSNLGKSSKQLNVTYPNHRFTFLGPCKPGNSHETSSNFDFLRLLALKTSSSHWFHILVASCFTILGHQLPREYQQVIVRKSGHEVAEHQGVWPKSRVKGELLKAKHRWVVMGQRAVDPGRRSVTPVREGSNIW